MKKIETAVSTVCIAVIIAVQAAFSTAFAADSGDWAALAEECFGYFSSSDGEFWSSAADSNSDWAAYCYARLHGSEGSEAYAAQLENRISELAETVSSGGFVKPTELQRTGIFLAAMEHDPSQAVELGVFQSETLGRQGFNAYIWALIALNVTGETAPDNSLNTAQSLTEYIVASQHDDGSFSLFGDGGDVDITSAAVYALASADSDEAQEAAQRGADWLCEIEGGYTSMGVRNCESTAQAVIALAAAGRTEKAEEAARQLAEYRRPDGGYAHLPDGDTNRMATAQTLEAFTALALSQRGEGLFSALPAVSPGLSSQDGSADIDVSADSQIAGNPENGNTAEPVIPGTAQSSAAPEQTHGFTGTHIKLIVSAAVGLAAAGMLAAAIIRRKKLLIPGAVLLAAVCGGVWLLDIRTPSEYYAQEVTGGMEVTFSADCKSVLGRMDTIDPSVNQPSVIPPDGVVIAECTLSLPEGSSAFDALITAARQQQVRVDYTGSSWGTYVRSIGYISEFGFGELSGWMYRVNGEFPQVYAGEFTLHEGDVVEFVYTCDLGGDVGDSYNAENAG